MTMNPTPIDRYFAAKCVKREVDAAYKVAESEAAIYLDEARENGVNSLSSTYFGEDAGEYKRGKTCTKQVVEYNVPDIVDFEAWCMDNQVALVQYAKRNASDFGQWWFETTGEIPDGIARVDYEEPPKPKAPSIYRYNHELVKAKLAEGGNLLEGANKLLLGGGDE